MKIIVSGASGLVGKNLIPVLIAKGHSVYRLVRKTPTAADEILWSEKTGIAESDIAKLEGFDAVIHLAGDNVASENWNEEKKRRIKESRTVGTKVLIDSFRRVAAKPKIFIAASAIGFYGDRGDEILDESSARGQGFFPDVCDAWETEIRRAAELGARTVTIRIGIVLSKQGGAVEKMYLPYSFGVGGVIAGGRQWMSWIALDDLTAMFLHLLENDLSGIFNGTAPNPATNAEFVKTFGKVLKRPTIFPIPAFAIKLLFGEMGETALLGGARVLPKHLLESGFEFKYPNLEAALRRALKN